MTVSVIGNVNADLVLRDVDQLADPGGEQHISDAGLRVGGGAGTTAMALAYLGLMPRLYGTVGDDALGLLILGQLSDHSLAADMVVRGRTGISVAVQSPRRDRSFLTYLGGLKEFSSPDVPACACDAELVIITGHFALPAFRQEGSRALLRAARDCGARTLFDPGPEPDGWSASGIAEIHALLPMVDVLLPDQDEACAYAGTSDPVAATLALATRSRGWVVTKLGSDGAAAAHPEHDLISLSAPPVAIADTTGAGDAFNAGLLYGLQAGLGVPGSLPLAIATASLTVGRPSGDRYPSIDEVRRAAPLVTASQPQPDHGGTP
jgi:ribokinase